MRDDLRNASTRPTEWISLVAVLLVTMLIAAPARAAPVQQTFATPEDAASALLQAAKSNERGAIRGVLGTGDLSSGDTVADRVLRERFVTAYDAKHAIVRDGDTAKLTIGNDDFPFAFPIVRSGDRWHFDAEAGRNELVARRIGENELDAIKVLRAIVDAQLQYASVARSGDGVVAYARKFVSTHNKQDGLYWPTKAGEPDSPLGSLVARASGEGYSAKSGTPAPFHGYYYRMLAGQGKDAAGGAQDYVVRGRQIGGFGVVAYPAKYGNSGIMTFVVNQDGKVFQTDLGPTTQAKAQAMKRFNPGTGWTPVSTP